MDAPKQVACSVPVAQVDAPCQQEVLPRCSTSRGAGHAKHVSCVIRKEDCGRKPWAEQPVELAERALLNAAAPDVVGPDLRNPQKRQRLLDHEAAIGPADLPDVVGDAAPKRLNRAVDSRG